MTTLTTVIIRRRVIDVRPPRSKKTTKRAACRKRSAARRQAVAELAKRLGLTPTPRVALAQDGGFWRVQGCVEGGCPLPLPKLGTVSEVMAVMGIGQMA